MRAIDKVRSALSWGLDADLSIRAIRVAEALAIVGMLLAALVGLLAIGGGR